MTILDIIKFLLWLVVIIGIVVLLVKYGNTPVEDMPVWVWWLLK